MEFTDGFPQPLFKGLCADDLWTVSCCFRGGSNYTLQEGHRARTRADRASCRIRKGTGCVGRYRCGPPAMDKGDGTQTDLGHRSTLSGHGHAKVANPMKTDPKRFLYLRPPSTFRHPRNRSILPNNSRASNKEKRKSLQAPRASRSDRSERAPVRLNQGALASRRLYPIGSEYQTGIDGVDPNIVFDDFVGERLGKHHQRCLRDVINRLVP